jgi:hypothetical protein
MGSSPFRALKGATAVLGTIEEVRVLRDDPQDETEES